MYQQRFGAAFQPLKLPKISQYTETLFIQNSSLSTMVTRKKFKLIKKSSYLQQPDGNKTQFKAESVRGDCSGGFDCTRQGVEAVGTVHVVWSNQN